MGRQIPIPATVLESLAESAHIAAREQGRKGYKNNEKDLVEARKRAYEAIRGVEGSSFTSIDKAHLSTLTAFGEHAPAEAKDTARTFLEQYDVW